MLTLRMNVPIRWFCLLGMLVPALCLLSLPRVMAQDDPPELVRCTATQSPPEAVREACTAAVHALDAQGRTQGRFGALSTACHLGRHPPSCYEAGLMRLDDGDALARDAAARLFRKSCSFEFDKGCAPAEALEKGQPWPPASADAAPPPAAPAPSSRFPAEPDAEEIADCIERGKPSICEGLAQSAMEGEFSGGTPDARGALTYLSRACDLGRAKACLKAGALLSNGQMLTPDYGASYTEFNKACALNVIEGCQGAAAAAARQTPPNGAAVEAAAQRMLEIDPQNARGKAILERLHQARGSRGAAQTPTP